MEQARLALYRVERGYLQTLSREDSHVMPVPEEEGGETRPPVWVLVSCGRKPYCVPLGSPKDKHLSMNNDLDFYKILDAGQCIGVLNFSAMIPVRCAVLQPLELNPAPEDTPEETQYKQLAKKQLGVCQKNHGTITGRANRLYRMIYSGRVDEALRQRCCDFHRLEQVLREYQQPQA